MEVNLATVIISFAVSMFGVYIYAFLKKTGENSATERGIQKVTALVETVKNEFSMQLLEFKTSTDTLTHRKTTFATLEIQAIYDFVVACHAYADIVHNYDPILKAIDVEAVRLKIRSIQTSYGSEEAKIEIFFFTTEFIRLKAQFNLMCLKYQAKTSASLTATLQSFKLLETYETYNKLGSPNYVEGWTKIYEQRALIYEQYKNEIMEDLTSFHEVRQQLLGMLRNRLLNIV